jgi:ABC-2 type transport system ATP-binding protein
MLLGMITVEHLTKRYGSHTAVDDVSFSCAAGTVTGFLGPNGAGKSTTLRMLTGLTLPTSGATSIGGLAYRDLRNPGRLVGSMLDAAAQHPGRTGRETLSLAASATRVPKGRIDEMLERVDLTGAAGRRVGQYSLGMRQRLGIAQALIGDPHVLILDEPANGLDPEGIRWMRALVRDFAERGGTVLLSSHLLTEVQATVDRLVVIGNGRIIADGDLSELLSASGVVVRGLDATGLMSALAAAGLDARYTGDGAFAVEADRETVGRAAAAAGQVVTELRDADGAGLEELFFSLTASDAGATTTNATTGRAAA